MLIRSQHPAAENAVPDHPRAQLHAFAVRGVGFSAYLTGPHLGLPLPIAVHCVFSDCLAT